MAEYTLNARVRHARKPEATWTSKNPVLLQDEIGFVKETGRFKIGDGTTAWNSLSYATVDPIAHSATLITSGTLNSNRLPTVPVSKGGTGATTLDSGKALIGNGTGAVTTRTITNITAKGALGWTSDLGANLVNLNTLAYWNGAYSGTSSNLSYCSRGAFGTIVTKAAGDYLAVGGTAVAAKKLVSAAQLSSYAFTPSTYIADGEVVGLWNNNSSTDTNGFPQANTSGGILFGRTNAAVVMAARAGQTVPTIYVKQYYQSWGEWALLLHSLNYTSYTVKKDGTGATGTWGISISGNAATASSATKVANALSINGKSFNGSSAINVGTIGVGYGGTGATTFTNNYILMGNGTSAIKTGNIHLNYATGTTSATGYEELVIGNSTPAGTAGNRYGRLALYSAKEGGIYLIAADTGSWSYTSTLPAANGTLLNSGNYTSYTVSKTGSGASGTWGISITGNANTATTLQIARTINGTSFNGSANITTANWGTARTLTIGNTGKSVNGGGNVSWTLGEIGAAPVSGSLNYVKVYNSSNVTSTDNVSVNDLAKQHAAVAMVNNATDNPLGAKKWIHVWNQSWNNGVNTSWVSQIALGVEGSNGIWYRTTQGTVVGAAWKRIYDSSHHPLADTSYAVYDKTNTTTKIYLNYGAAGITSPSWFAAWNGYELRAISPANVLSTIKALPLAGGTLTGNLYIKKEKTSVGAHVYSYNSSGTQIGQIDIYGNSLSGLFYDAVNDVEINTIIDMDGFYIDHPLNGIAYLNPSELYLSAGIATIGGAAYFKTATNYFYNGSYYTAINRPSASANYTLYLPSATGQLVYHTNDTAIGGAAKPVYIAASGAATACSSTIGSVNRPVYMNAGTITALTSVSTAYGGTGVTSHTANRLVWSTSATAIQAGYHYASATKVAINSASAPTENFYVNGSSKFSGALNVSGNNVTITNTLYPVIYFKNTTNTCYSMFEGSYTGAANLWAVGTSGENYRRAIAIYDPQTRTGLTNALTLRMCNAGAWSEYNVLHTGNYTTYVVPKTGGTFTGAVTIDGSNALNVGTQLKMWSDGEGGNIRLYSQTSTTKCFEFDVYDANLRLYYSTTSGSSASQSWAWKSTGVFMTPYLSINGNSTSYRLYCVGNGYFSGSLRATNIQLAEGLPLYFYGNGSGTYTMGVMYCNSGGIIFETPRATDSSDAAALGFFVKTRGGYDAPLFCANVNASGISDFKGRLYLYGSENVSNANAPFYGAIEVREAGQVGSAQSAITYAPKIGFHWAGRVASALALHSDNYFYRVSNNGTAYKIVDKACFSLSGTTLTITV